MMKREKTAEPTTRRKNKPKPAMITKSRLKSERGWTDKLIDTFMPEPDATAVNPNYKSGPPMLLFSVKRIERIEKREKFKAAREKAEKCRSAANKSVGTKMKKTMEEVSRMKISVRTLKKEKLVNCACIHYNRMQNSRAWQGLPSSETEASPKSDAKFIARICVNFIRHNLTKYEEHLDDIHGLTGASEAYLEIKRKIFSAISDAYPWLTKECRRQMVETETNERMRRGL